ncbi:MAG: hypothetical protein DMG96_42925 [Acidobacteria bacterium]|nr:MAG: hypothetical protein DMG96_42925 [Acidobacteriota bacterium]
MKRTLGALYAVAVLAAMLLLVSANPANAQTPLWVQHVKNFPGGISNGVRAHLDPAVARARSRIAASPSPAQPTLNNLQMNDDPTPDLPQNETQVVLNPSDPMNAVSAANDFVTGGLWIGRTTDGGQHWSSFRAAPTSSKGETCFGGDPALAFSVRDQAFYAAQLCFFSFSEVQLWKSVDNGATWTPSALGSTVFTNIAADGSVDGSLFFDKDLMAVDNNPSSPHYGRIYVTAIKFHLLAPSGRSDFCPVQLAHTDEVPTSNPRSAKWSRVSVVADAPFSDTGPSANQWALPLVDDQGGVDIAYASEDCNTAFDRGLFFKRSTDGGNTFGTTVQIDKPGQFADNPNPKDLLPAKKARLPLSPSLAFNPVTKSLEFVYQNNINRTISGADISFQQSQDYGATWSNANTISTTGNGDPAPNDQFFPWIAVDEGGDLHVIWYDNRNDPGNKLIETFQAFSANDGATWTNFNISTAPWNPDKGFFSCGCFIGDYNGLAASNEVIYPVWTDGRNSAGSPNGQTDIFTNIEIQ